MNEEIKKYIQDSLKDGLTLENIRKNLIDAGWSKEDVDGEIQRSQGHFQARGRKSKIFTLLISVIILSLGVFIWLRISEFSIKHTTLKDVKELQPPASPLDSITQCQQITDSASRDGCLFNLLSQNYDLTICDQILDLAVRDACLYHFAMVKKDPVICTRIKSTMNIFGEKSPFSDMCIYGLALRMKDVSLCDRISSVKDKEICWLDFPAESVCQEFSDGYRKDLCWQYLARAKKDATICQQSSKTTECLGHLAADLGDVTICQNSDVCLSLVGYNYKGADESVCRAVAASTRPGECLRSVAAVKQDIGICDREFPDWAGCYISVASAAQKPEYCNRLIKPDDISRCYADVANKASESAVCVSIPEVKGRDLCYYQVARKMKDPKICSLIVDISRQSDCNLLLTANPELCLDEDGLGKDNCLINIAEETGQSSVCQYVDSTDSKFSCYISSLELRLGAILEPNDSN